MCVCPKCQSDQLVNNGSTAGKPKKLCQQCGYQFTRTTPRGKPLKTKINAVLLYLSGISMNRIAFLLRVSAQSVLNWIRAFAKEHDEKPEPTGRIIVLELDEMWHYLKKKRQKLWIWKALDRDTGQLLDWECGRRDKATLQKLVDRLAQGDVKVYCTDKWATYASVISQDKLVQSKATTHNIERNHCRQRHWFGRFKHKSIIVSKSKEMVDLTIALFAKFWVNANQDELVSLLRVLTTFHRKPPLSDFSHRRRLGLAHAVQIEVVLSKGVNMLPHEWRSQAQDGLIKGMSFAPKLLYNRPNVQGVPGNHCIVEH